MGSFFRGFESFSISFIIVFNCIIVLKWVELQVQVVESSSARFPSCLMGIEPVIERLYYRGKWDKVIFGKCVAIVGSRAMTKYGRTVIARLVPELVGRGYTTVSGFMYGVDIEVHRLTYMSGGRTIAVLPHGIEKKIEVENASLYDKLIESDSLFVSEHEGKFPGMKHVYPLRNRIVVGLASDVIVIEGAKKSGSMISGHLALQQGKRLWAVPGPVNSKVSEGTNQLIKDGMAQMLTFDDLNLYSEKDAINRPKHKMSRDESKIVELIEGEGGLGVNELVRKLGWEAAKVVVIVGGLEMRGIIREKGGLYACTQLSG